ncbi:hypothetical protein MOV65_19845 [Neorhizobium sp. SHOUNA12B]|nr:hypothetical protein [Neorhizobium sp. SHOUNA12B]
MRHGLMLAAMNAKAILDGDAIVEEHMTPQDLLTAAKKKVGAMLTKLLQENFFDIGIIGEEKGDGIQGNGELYAITGLIDGPENFVSGRLHWSVSLSLWTKKDGPVFGIVYYPSNHGLTYDGGPEHGICMYREPAKIVPCQSKLVQVGSGRLGPDDDRVVSLSTMLRKQGSVPLGLGCTTADIELVISAQAIAYMTVSASACELAGMYAIFSTKPTVESETLTFEIFALDTDNKVIDGPVDFITASQEQRYAAVVARPEDIKTYLAIMRAVLGLPSGSPAALV